MKESDFKKKVLPLKNLIFRTALRITLSREEAEDLTQDTLLKLWARRNELDAVKSLEALSITIARRLALDKIAKKEQQNLSLEAASFDAEDNTSSPHELMEKREQLKKINDLVSALPEAQRTAFQLRDIEGMSYQESAEAMNVSEALFKVTLHRARKAIRAAYEKTENYGL